MVAGCLFLVADGLFLVADGLFLVVGSVFCLPEVFFWLPAGCFLLPAGCCPALSAQTKPPEHKIVVFVLFWPSEPSFSGFSSTKSAFLCAFCLQDPRYLAFRAQNRGFCALLGSGAPVFKHFEHKIGVFVLGKR